MFIRLSMVPTLEWSCLGRVRSQHPVHHPAVALSLACSPGPGLAVAFHLPDRSRLPCLSPPAATRYRLVAMKPPLISNGHGAQCCEGLPAQSEKDPAPRHLG